MAEQTAAKLVTAGEVSREFDIPPRTIYRLVEQGLIPYHDDTRIWHATSRYRFDLAEVRAALQELARKRGRRVS